MATFVPIDEYLSYYDLSSSADLRRAEVDLAVACDMIRDYLNQTIDRVAGDVVTLYGTDTRAMLVPELPVVSVASVVSVATTSTPATAITDWTVDPYGVLWRDWPYAWDSGLKYTATYTHGYLTAEVPSILKVVAFQLAKARSSSAPEGVTQESVAGYSVTYAQQDSGRSPLLGILDRHVVRKVPTA